MCDFITIAYFLYNELDFYVHNYILIWNSNFLEKFKFFFNEIYFHSFINVITKIEEIITFVDSKLIQ